MREMRQSTRRCARQSTRVRTRQKIKELIMTCVSSIIKAPLLDSLTPKAKLIQVTSIAIKHANKSFLSRLGGFFLHISLGVEGCLGIGWVVGFGGFDCCFLFVIVGARNELGSTLLTLIHLTKTLSNKASLVSHDLTIPPLYLFLKTHFVPITFTSRGAQLRSKLGLSQSSLIPHAWH
jgi:hypothetical protein